MENNSKHVLYYDDIPAQLPINYAFTAKDALAIISCYVFLIAPMTVAMHEVSVSFGVVDRVPVRDQLHGIQQWQFLSSAAIAGVSAALIGKYIWLISMCRFLSRINVGWLIAYGRPRRIGRLDRAIVERFYRRDDNRLEMRLVPPKPTGYLIGVMAIVYTGGALLEITLGKLHLSPRDHSPWPLSIFLLVLALLHLILWHRTKMR